MELFAIASASTYVRPEGAIASKDFKTWTQISDGYRLRVTITEAVEFFADQVVLSSVAAVARSFELNDNLVHQWRRGRGVGTAKFATPRAQKTPEFVALSLPGPPAPQQPPDIAMPSESIRIELKRGSLSVNVLWPLSAAVDCAAWLRELLR